MLDDSVTTIESCTNGAEAVAKANQMDFDIIFMDIQMPIMDGISACKAIRSGTRNQSTPIIAVTAQAMSGERDRLLSKGMDDYLTKPFGVGELIARLRVLLRRHAKRGEDGGSVIRFGEVEVDLARRLVTRNGEAVHLTPIEYRLLAVLLGRRGTVMTHRELLREVWGPAHSDSSHYLRIYMGHLRHKLERDPARPEYLLTEVGVGYRFTA